MANLKDEGMLYDFDIPDESIPAGTHPAGVMEATWDEGPNAPYISIQFVVTSGPAKGEPIYENLTLSPNSWARRRTRSALRNIFGREVKGRLDMNKVLAAMPGHEVQLLIKIGEFEGEKRAEVSRILPPAPEGGAEGDFLSAPSTQAAPAAAPAPQEQAAPKAEDPLDTLLGAPGSTAAEDEIPF